MKADEQFEKPEGKKETTAEAKHKREEQRRAQRREDKKYEEEVEAQEEAKKTRDFKENMVQIHDAQREEEDDEEDDDNAGPDADESAIKTPASSTSLSSKRTRFGANPRPMPTGPAVYPACRDPWWLGSPFHGYDYYESGKSLLISSSFSR